MVSAFSRAQDSDYLTKTATLCSSTLLAVYFYSPFLEKKKKKQHPPPHPKAPHKTSKYGEWSHQMFSGKSGPDREMSDGGLEIKSLCEYEEGPESNFLKYVEKSRNQVSL